MDSHTLCWIVFLDLVYRVHLLKQRDKNANPEWVNKLPQMVKQLEVSLYRSAPSFEAYADKKTLKQRLQNLAMDIAKKTEKEPRPGPGSGGETAATTTAARSGGMEDTDIAEATAAFAVLALLNKM